MGRIEISGLSKSYGGVPALVDLNLVVEDGEFVTLLGPSGCGKTTTLNLLAGFLGPDQGTIVIDGKTVSAPGKIVEPSQRQMGMVFQSYALWPHKTVFANVAYGLQRMKLPRTEVTKRVDAMLDMVGLAGYRERYPGKLSGGQQQRVALARSLVTEPSMLLLDEPLSNLDAKLRSQMRFEVQQIQRRLGTTFVYVTHDQVEALSMSDRVAVMELGRLQQYGSPNDIYLHPATAFVADFMGLINFIPGEVTEVRPGGTRLVRLSLDNHTLEVSPASGHQSFDVGSRVMVGLRPEVIRIGSADRSSRDVAMVGEVIHFTVLGNIVQYVVSVSGQKLKVQADYGVEIGIGELVGLQVDSGQARAFDANDPTFGRLVDGDLVSPYEEEVEEG